MNTVKTIFLVAIVSLVVSACASKGIDLTAEKQLEIKNDDSYRGKLHNIKVLKKADQVLVTGLVVRNTRQRYLDGHIHVDVYDENNLISQSLDSDYHFRRTGLRKARSARFQAELAMAPVQHGRIVVTHHDVDTGSEPLRAQPDSPAAGGGVLLIE